MSAVAVGQAAANPWLAQTVVIAEMTVELEGIKTYHLAFRDAAVAESYCFLPGQFNMLYLPGVGEVAISVSGNPATRGTWAHTIRVAGNVTGTLARLKRGESLGLRGPFGTHWPLEQFAGMDVVLVAGGVGLAPLRPAIYALLAERERYGAITLLSGARTPENLLFRREYADWTARGLVMQSTVDRAAPGWSGHVGVVTLLLGRMTLDRPANTAVIMCGPEVMMRYAVRGALERGIPEDHIWLSLERNMQCAAGLCGHCQLGPAFVCKDGPVFRHDRIAPFLYVEGL